MQVTMLDCTILLTRLITELTSHLCLYRGYDPAKQISIDAHIGAKAEHR